MSLAENTPVETVDNNQVENAQSEPSRGKRTSIRPIEEVFRYSQARGSARRLLCIMAEHSVDSCFVSTTDWLARESGLSEQTVKRALRELGETGEILEQLNATCHTLNGRQRVHYVQFFPYAYWR
jgi:hypothetical protein